MKKTIVGLIGFYQKYLGLYKKPTCVFFPTCSEYAKEAILKYGTLRGLFLSARRILRCHPWQKERIDPVK